RCCCRRWTCCCPRWLRGQVPALAAALAGACFDAVGDVELDVLGSQQQRAALGRQLHALTSRAAARRMPQRALVSDIAPCPYQHRKLAARLQRRKTQASAWRANTRPVRRAVGGEER